MYLDILCTAKLFFEILLLLEFEQLFLPVTRKIRSKTFPHGRT